jgi:hypothetical protein
MWTRSARVLAAALLTALALSGCADDGDDTATDPDTNGETTNESPSDTPTVGTYPTFEPEDYAYTLAVTCFCPDAGLPVRVTVKGGEVAEAVYAQKGAGVDRGEAAPEYRELTINDIIDELNASAEAESVRVEWPDGQDYPSTVSIDQSSRIADEEIGYTISEVEVGRPSETRTPSRPPHRITQDRSRLPQG